MKHVISFLAISSMLVFLSCSPEYEGNVGGASDPNYCKAPSLVNDTGSNQTISLSFDTNSTTSSADYTSGCEIYVEKCANCHMLNGLAKNIALALGDATDEHENDGVDTLCTACEVGEWLGPRIATDMPPKRGDSVHLTEIEAAKVAVYIRAKFYDDITPLNDKDPENLPESMRPDEDLVNVEGLAVYQANSCGACHGDDGQGASLYQSPMIHYTSDRNTLIGKLKSGGGNAGYTTLSAKDEPMPPPSGGGLTDLEIGQLADYMNEAFDYGW